MINAKLGHDAISMVSVYLFWLVSLSSIGMIVPYFYLEDVSRIDGVSNALDMADRLFTLFMAFALRGGLEQLLSSHNLRDDKTRFGGLWTFLFGIYYLQWKINRNREAGVFTD